MRRSRKRKPFKKKDNLFFKTNHQIKSPTVRLAGENIEQGIYTIEEAIRISKSMEIDLVEISPNAKPPVCKVIDYKKFLYDKKKKEKELKQKQKEASAPLKEIRFTSNTDDHDMAFKATNAKKFLEDGSKVKAYVQFKGRNIQFKERGELVLLKFVNMLEEHGSIGIMPKLEGRKMHVLINPKKG